ncbi:MAG: shikimate kinase [Ruminococcus flavefaciens]|nr:shikimate kinase [Ruminococcus flavefaciens]MCM1231222.1 shikimate kinase [Ruminococcus flavefaciens]
MTIFLCGFMGCGKTTVGQLTAKKMGCAFYDTDELIVENQGMSIPEIFEKKGEPYFRQVEADIVKSMCGKSAVISCGGGAMINPDTAKAVAEAGEKIVFLDVDFDTCYERISGDSNRPIVVNNTKEQLRAIFDERHRIYEKHATVCINAEGSPVEMAEAVRRSVC